MRTTMQATEFPFARLVREEIREEVRTRMLPTLLRFLDDEVETVRSMQCDHPLEKVQLERLATDLLAIRLGIESFVATSVALLEDR